MTESHVCSLKTASLLSLYIVFLPLWFLSRNWIIQRCEVVPGLLEEDGSWVVVQRVLDHLSCLTCRQRRSQRSHTLSCKMRIKRPQRVVVTNSVLFVGAGSANHQGGNLWGLLQFQESPDHPNFPAKLTCQRGCQFSWWCVGMCNKYVISHIITLLTSHCNDQSRCSGDFSVLCEQVLWQSFLAGIALLWFKANAKISACAFFLITFMA